MLTIPLEKLYYIIEKAREFDAEEVADADDASNDIDDDERSILLDTPDNPAMQELHDAIEGLNIDEKEELLALTWLGRGDFEAKEWRKALELARTTLRENEADYLVGTPMLADYLEEAISALGIA